MQILMLTSSYPRFENDGAGSFVRSIASHVAKQGNRVVVLAPRVDSISNPPVDDRVAVSFFRYSPLSQFRVMGYGRALRADIDLKREAYVGAAGFLVSALFSLVRAIRRDRCDVLHAHWLLPSGFVAAMASKITGVPLMISLHGSDVYLGNRNTGFRWASSFALGNARSVVACSGDLLTRAGMIRTLPEPSKVIPYGVDSQLFLPSALRRRRGRERFGIPESEVMVLAAGRLVEKKGFEYLLDAAPSILAHMPRQVRLVIGGGGDSKGALEAKARSLGISNSVVFAGALSQHEMADLMAAADIVAVPSIHDRAGNVDGLPNILLEAMAAGRAVVTTPVGGIPSVITNRENGVIVEEKSSEQIASAILALASCADYRSALGNAARLTVVSKHSWVAASVQYCDSYSAMVDASAGTSYRW